MMRQFEHWVRQVAAILGFGHRRQIIVVYRTPPRHLRY
jgi:hypothetical protein